MTEMLKIQNISVCINVLTEPLEQPSKCEFHIFEDYNYKTFRFNKSHGTYENFDLVMDKLKLMFPDRYK